MSGPSTVAKSHMNWLLRHCDAAATERLAAAVNVLLHPQTPAQEPRTPIMVLQQLSADQVTALQAKWIELLREGNAAAGPLEIVGQREAGEQIAPISMPTAVVALCAVLGDVISTTEPKQQHLLVIAIGALLAANVNACNLHRAAESLAAEAIPEETRH